jgi:hypothetical protein
MTLSHRERYISVVVLVAAAAFMLDRLALTPYLERRDVLIDQRQTQARKLADAQLVLRQERQFRQLLADMGASVAAEPSAVEGQFLHMLHEWEQQSGVAKASFNRQRSVEAHGFTHMTFHVSATGAIGAVAMLLHQLETAPIPLRLDEVQVLPKRDGAEELQLELSVSTLCRKGGVKRPERTQARDVAAIELTGERR